MTENKKPPAGLRSAPGALQNGSDGGKVPPRPRMVNHGLSESQRGNRSGQPWGGFEEPWDGGRLPVRGRVGRGCDQPQQLDLLRRLLEQLRPPPVRGARCWRVGRGRRGGSPKSPRTPSRREPNFRPQEASASRAAIIRCAVQPAAVGAADLVPVALHGVFCEDWQAAGSTGAHVCGFAGEVCDHPAHVWQRRPHVCGRTASNEPEGLSGAWCQPCPR